MTPRSTGPLEGHRYAQPVTWRERALSRSPVNERSQQRSLEQAREIIGAAETLMLSGDLEFTIQRLVAEAGIALQTFYRYFSGKDELLLAVLEETIASGARDIAAVAAGETERLARLRSIMMQTLERPIADEAPVAGRVVTSLHLRLQERYPSAVEEAMRPFAVLVRGAIDDATAAGLIDPLDPERDAWLMTRIVVAMHHPRTADPADEDPIASAQHVWNFCLCALRASPAALSTDVTPRAARRTRGSQRRSPSGSRTPG
jgi:TetR/AcrR family transcriptional regulator